MVSLIQRQIPVIPLGDDYYQLFIGIFEGKSGDFDGARIWSGQIEENQRQCHDRSLGKKHRYCDFSELE